MEDFSASAGEDILSSVAPMVVAVRCRALNEREKSIAALRFPNRADTDYCSVVRCSQSKGIIGVIDPDSVGTFQCDLYDEGRYSAQASRTTEQQKRQYDREYRFDLVFDPSSSNADVYKGTVAPLVRCVREGYNGTCFAYGMTGAGKTHTMLGTAETKGLCSLAVEDLFPKRFQDEVVTVHASYLELYNERIRDLLVPGNSKSSSGASRSGQSFSSLSFSNTEKHSAQEPSLEIVEDPENGIVVQNLSEVLVTKASQLELLIEEAGKRRTKAPMSSNAVSSRSHAILQLVVRRRIPQPSKTASGNASATQTNQDKVLVGKMSLIDLAGSERASVDGSDQQQDKRRLEGANINRSLLSLGNCITILGNMSRTQQQEGGLSGKQPSTGSVHIPYRDSKLTRLLKESLGGNTRTVMIASITPSCLCFEETLSTLKYASRAKCITKSIQRNVVTVEARVEEQKDYQHLIRTLQSEVDSLRTQLFITQQTNVKLGLLPSDAPQEQPGTTSRTTSELPQVAGSDSKDQAVITSSQSQISVVHNNKPKVSVASLERSQRSHLNFMASVRESLSRMVLEEEELGQLLSRSTSLGVSGKSRIGSSGGWEPEPKPNRQGQVDLSQSKAPPEKSVSFMTAPPAASVVKSTNVAQSSVQPSQQVSQSAHASVCDDEDTFVYVVGSPKPQLQTQSALQSVCVNSTNGQGSTPKRVQLGFRGSGIMSPSVDPTDSGTQRPSVNCGKMDEPQVPLRLTEPGKAMLRYIAGSRNSAFA